MVRILPIALLGLFAAALVANRGAAQPALAALRCKGFPADYERSYACALVDVDGDGDLDVLIGNATAPPFTGRA